MTVLFQPLVRLSMFAGVAAGTLAVAAPAGAGTAASPYYGRWTVAEERPVFTARGRPYKTIDIATCGRDFCGVSVDDTGKCGTVLFRFLAQHATLDLLRGHGRWGSEQKNLEINSYGNGPDDGGAGFELYLGDGHDFGGRSPNMPKFHADYRRTGTAKCVAR